MEAKRTSIEKTNIITVVSRHTMEVLDSHGENRMEKREPMEISFPLVQDQADYMNQLAAHLKVPVDSFLCNQVKYDRTNIANRKFELENDRLNEDINTVNQFVWPWLPKNGITLVLDWSFWTKPIQTISVMDKKRKHVEEEEENYKEAKDQLVEDLHKDIGNEGCAILLATLKIYLKEKKPIKRFCKLNTEEECCCEELAAFSTKAIKGGVMTWKNLQEWIMENKDCKLSKKLKNSFESMIVNFF